MKKNKNLQAKNSNATSKMNTTTSNATEAKDSKSTSNFDAECK